MILLVEPIGQDFSTQHLDQVLNRTLPESFAGRISVLVDHVAQLYPEKFNKEEKTGPVVGVICSKSDLISTENLTM